MNTKYVDTLIKYNRTGQCINYIKINMFNFSVDDLEYFLQKYDEMCFDKTGNLDVIYNVVLYIIENLQNYRKTNNYIIKYYISDVDETMYDIIGAVICDGDYNMFKYFMKKYPNISLNNYYCINDDYREDDYPINSAKQIDILKYMLSQETLIRNPLIDPYCYLYEVIHPYTDDIHEYIFPHADLHNYGVLKSRTGNYNDSKYVKCGINNKILLITKELLKPRIISMYHKSFCNINFKYTYLFFKKHHCCACPLKTLLNERLKDIIKN